MRRQNNAETVGTIFETQLSVTVSAGVLDNGDISTNILEQNIYDLIMSHEIKLARLK